MQLEQRGNGTFSNTWQIEMQEALCHNPICKPAPLSGHACESFAVLPPASCMLPPVYSAHCLAAPDSCTVRLQTASVAASSRALHAVAPPPPPSPSFAPARGSDCQGIPAVCHWLSFSRRPCISSYLLRKQALYNDMNR